MRQPGWFRLTRAGVFASVCVVLSLAGHDMMSPRRTPLWAGAAALAALTILGYALAGRRRSALSILVGVEGVQLCLHTAFAWATPRPPAPVMPMTSPMAHTMPMAHTASMGAGMFAAHALAGALVAGWLYAGERALWRALAVLGAALLTPVRRVFAVLSGTEPPRPPALSGAPEREDAPLRTILLRYMVARRGPPRTRVVSAFPLP